MLVENWHIHKCKAIALLPHFYSHLILQLQEHVWKLNSHSAALSTVSFLRETAPVMGFATEEGTAVMIFRRAAVKVYTYQDCTLMLS